MTDALAINAINREQLATAADRLLLPGAQSARRSAHNARRAMAARAALSMHVSGAQRDSVVREHGAPVAFGAPSHTTRSSASQPARTPGHGAIRRALFAFVVAIPTVVGIGLAVAALS